MVAGVIGSIARAPTAPPSGPMLVQVPAFTPIEKNSRENANSEKPNRILARLRYNDGKQK
jgi:hypothetical protein